MQENGIWSEEEAKSNHQFSKKLARALVSILSVGDRVIDMGCGPGKYVDFLNDHGFSTIGIEGTQFNHPKILIGDLTNPLDKIINISDVVISLEVAEHIPVEFEDEYLTNITTYASKKVILSWAIPGQCGLGHVNEQSNDQVIRKMSERGFYLVYDETEKLRSAVKDCHCWWFRNTLMVFTR